jgi:hypothetical protein
MRVKYKFHALNPLVYISTKRVANYIILPGLQAILLFHFIHTQNIAYFFEGLLAYEISVPCSNVLNTCPAKSECM